jgi:hypothetical protein
VSNPYEDKVNALACAIAVLEGTAGGYTPEAKMKAKMELTQMFADAASGFVVVDGFKRVKCGGMNFSIDLFEFFSARAKVGTKFKLSERNEDVCVITTEEVT